MGYLDNLESTLKNLEGNNERDSGEDRSRRESERAQALASAPYADELKNGAYTMGCSITSRRLALASERR
jgi:hypothetical protein